MPFCGNRSLPRIAHSRRHSAHAAEQSPVRSPISPQDSLEHIVVADGLKVELVAHEPNVIDPVAIRFDEDGRMWVVEMRDYPTGSPDGKTPFADFDARR